MGMDKVISYMKMMGMKKPKVDNFQDKIVVQKVVCLLDIMGVKTGYNFSLYIRGPYSTMLTREMYSHTAEFEGMKTDYVPSGREAEALGQIGEASGFEPAMLEIMATFAYIWKRQGKTTREAMLETKQLKPFYSDGQMAVATNRAKQLFPPSAKEIGEMKKEFSDWEGAASERSV